MASCSPRELYLDLLVRTLTNSIYGDRPIGFPNSPYSDSDRKGGKDWPSVAHTMVGRLRLGNLRDLAQRVIDESIPGHFIETGVWRGGSCMLMRGVLAANGIEDRNVYVADSFEGLPPPQLPQDEGDLLYTVKELAVSEDEVRENFEKYGLLDSQVVFVKGYFQQSLKRLEASPFALLRLDGDMYESTYVALEALYPRLSSGGFVIIDDYGAFPACRAAVEDYRVRHQISDALHEIDWSGVWWQKS